MAFVDFRARFVGVAEAATSSVFMPVIEAANSGAARSMPRRWAWNPTTTRETSSWSFIASRALRGGGSAMNRSGMYARTSPMVT